MNKSSIKFLKQLLNTPSPSGFEQKASALFRKRVTGFADTIKRDVHGNTMAILNPKAKLKIMLAGHIDEIGLMIIHIDDKGYLYIAPIGGIDPKLLLAQRIRVITKKGDIHGVIGKKPIHLMDADESKRPVKYEDLWVDIGAKDKKAAKKVVSIGDAIIIDTSFQQLQGELFTARGTDDKVGAFIVSEVIRKLARGKLNVCIIGTTTVQEEIGTRGAITASYNINPDAAIVYEVGHTSDYPTMDPKKHRDIKIGLGPILHRGANINPILGEALINKAIDLKLPHQLRAEPLATPTDTRAIQINRGGIASALIRIPNRYMHSPVEVMSLEDIDMTIKLSVEYLSNMNENIDFRP